MQAGGDGRLAGISSEGLIFDLVWRHKSVRPPSKKITALEEFALDGVLTRPPALVDMIMNSCQGSVVAMIGVVDCVIDKN